MRPELITTIKGLTRRLSCKEDQGCFLVDAKLQDIGNPLVYQLEANGKVYYISKLHFIAEPQGDKVRLCYFDAKKLPKDSIILKRIEEEMLAYLAHHKFDEMYESLNIPRQVIYKHIKKLPLKKKELIKKIDTIDFQEALEAYKQNKIEDLAVKYHTTPQHIYKLFLKGLIKRKKHLKTLLYENTLYVFNVLGQDDQPYCYYYRPVYDKEKKRCVIKYYARCADVEDKDLEKFDKEKQTIAKEIEKLEQTIKDVKAKLKAY